MATETIRDRLAALLDARPVLIAVILSTFFSGFGGGVVFPILPNLGEVAGIAAVWVGIILSANRFVRLVVNAPAGALVDRIGTRAPFVAGLTISGVATTGYVIALWAVDTPIGPPEAWFLLARVLWGFGSALVFATAYTIAADIGSDGSRGFDMGLVRGGVTLGFPAGLVLGGIVSDLGGNAMAFGTAALLAFTASAIAWVTVPETHVDSERESVKPWEIDRSVATLTVGLVNFSLLFAYIGSLFSTLVIFLRENTLGIIGYGPQGSSGLLMAITVLAAAVTMFAGGKASDRLDSRVPVLVGFLALFFIGFLLFTATTSSLLPTKIPLLALSCVLIGGGYGGTSGPMTALLADLTREERMGRAMGTNNVLGDIGGGLGPLVSVPLVETIGFTPVYAICAIFPMIAAITLVVGLYVETGEVSPGTATRIATDPDLDTQCAPTDD
jgi:MFS family permease